MSSVQTPQGRMPVVIVERLPNLLKITWPDMKLEVYYGVKLRQCVPIYKRVGKRSRILISELCREAQAILTVGGRELLIDGKFATRIKQMLSRFPDDVFEVQLPEVVLSDVRRYLEEVASQMS